MLLPYFLHSGAINQSPTVARITRSCTIYVFGTLIRNDYSNIDINFSIINLIKIILNGGQESSEESVFMQDKGQHIPDTGLCEISEGNSDGLEYEIYEYC